MKKYIVTALAVLCIVGVALARINYRPSPYAEGLSDGSVLMSSQIGWNILDSTTVDGDAPADLVVDERTYKTVLAAIKAGLLGDEEITITHIPPTWNAVRFRCIGKTPTVTVTHQIYFGTLAGGADCELAKAGQLAWTIGAQVSTTDDYEIADEVAVTDYCWNKSWGKKTPANDLVAEATIDVLGADLIVVVTSVVNCDCKLLGKGV